MVQLGFAIGEVMVFSSNLFPWAQVSQTHGVYVNACGYSTINLIVALKRRSRTTSSTLMWSSIVTVVNSIKLLLKLSHVVSPPSCIFLITCDSLEFWVKFLFSGC